MARTILFAWELGADIGHLGPLSALARELKARGSEPVFALRSLRYAEKFLGRYGLRYMQAPVPRSVARAQEAPLNYSELLHHAGFLDWTGLLSVVKAWQEIFQLVKPAALVADHAPSALLAARASALPRAVYGTGFCFPPRLSPFPSTQPWLSVPEGYLRQCDDRVLASVNRALHNLGAAPLERLCDLFDVEEELLCTFPELDHYPNRPAARYYGPAYGPDLGLEPQWGESGEKRVFGYLHPDTPRLEALLEQASGLGHDFLWVIPGLRSELRLRFEAPRFRFSTELYKLSRAARQCDVAITNAGHGTTAAFLLNGVPLMMIPRYLEQYLVARNVSRLGAGLVLEDGSSAPDYRSTLERLLGSEACAYSAEAFAQKYSGFDPQRQIAVVADRIEKLG
jgi:UDP:flavonoid glycosyltransferase YjiC (YdhE family)